MITSASDRAFLRGQFPEFQLTGLTDEAFDDYLDAWFAHDHYDNNPAYAYVDESDDQ